MNQLLLNNINELIEICKNHRVEKISAFGSVCTENFNKNSDIDFIIKFDTTFFDGYVDNFFLLE